MALLLRHLIFLFLYDAPSISGLKATERFLARYKPVEHAESSEVKMAEEVPMSWPKTTTVLSKVSALASAFSRGSTSTGKARNTSKLANTVSPYYGYLVQTTAQLLQPTGFTNYLTYQIAKKIFETEPPTTRSRMADVTPGNMNNVSANITFQSFCVGPPTAYALPATWYDVAEEPAAKNAQRGFSRITFCSRKSKSYDPCVNISGWYLPSPVQNRPTIIFSHGFRTEGLHMDVITPASWARNKLAYNALVIDYRNHGHSENTNGHRSWGEPELRDLLGAVDCIKLGCDGTSATNVSKIGLHGASGGAYQVYQAVSVETQIPGIWLSSGVFSMTAFTAFHIKNLVPNLDEDTSTFLADVIHPKLIEAGAKYGFSQEMSPVNLIIPEPMSRFPPRKVFMTHASGDHIIPATETSIAEQRMAEKGFTVSKWVVQSPPKDEVTCHFPADIETYDSHVDAMVLDPQGFIYYMHEFWIDVFGE